MTTPANPWLTPDPAPLPVPAPEPAVIVPADTRPVFVRGAHGGAGASTLAHLVPGLLESVRPVAGGQRVVLVCRSHANGLVRAQSLLAAWAQTPGTPVRVEGLVVNADAPGRLPRPLRHVVDLLSGAVPHVWTVPWVEAWRLSPDAPEPDRSVESTVRDLLNLTSATGAW